MKINIESETHFHNFFGAARRYGHTLKLYFKDGSSKVWKSGKVPAIETVKAIEFKTCGK